MSIVTFDAAVAANPATRCNSFWRGLLDAMIASRMRRAEREIARRRHLLPRELDRMDWKVGERSEDSLPFVR